MGARGPDGDANLAEHGADVLRITAPHLPHLGDTEYEIGLGKLSAELDLRAPRDVVRLRDPVRETDVFVQGYRPGSMARRGFSAEALAELRPGIVVALLSAFGHVGPWAERRGVDRMIQAVTGIADRQGTVCPGSRPGPRFYPASVVDYLAGYLVAFGTLVALARRVEEGGSWLVRTSLAQAAEWLLDRGEVAPETLPGVPSELGLEELSQWSMTTDSPAGRLRHLGPALQLSETRPYWARPAVPLGYHDPIWPV